MKKLFTLLILLLLWAGSSWAQSVSTSVSNIPEKKVASINAKDFPIPPAPLGPLQGGETIASATVISSLPYNDVGTTAGYIDNYNEECPYTATGGRDVVYSYTPAANGAIDITLCNDATAYDTKLYVYDTPTPVTGDAIACNDDVCSTVAYPSPYVSEVLSVPVTAGTTYYIVVDGYSSADYGAYAITVTAVISPILIATPSLLGFGYSPAGTPTASQTYVLSGSNLTAGPIVVTAPSGFEVSANNSTWVTTFNVTYTPPTLPNTTVWVRFNPPAGNTAYSGNVTNIGGSASANVAVTGSSIVPPPNDDCVNATVVAGPFPQTVNGTTLNATVDCPGLLDWNAVWYAVTLPYAINDLTVDWCGTANMSTVGVVYYETCPVVCGDYQLYTTNVWSVCGTPAGATTALTSFIGIPGPATIYYPAYSIPQMDHVITFNVVEVLCPDPTDLTADNITTTSANLTWTPAGSETAWEYDFGLSPWPVPAGSGTATNSSTVNPISPLLPGTTYQYYVRADCGGGTFSDWVGPYTFATSCDVIVAPWCEHFQTQVIPNCWTMSGPQSWLFTTTWPAYGAAGLTDHTGTGGSFAGVDGSGTAGLTGITLTSPLLDKSAMTTAQLRFFVFNNNTSSILLTDEQQMTVSVWDGVGGWQLAYTWPYGKNNASWEEVIIPLASYSSPIQLSFVVDKGTGLPFYDDMIIDDICVEIIPTCPAPNALTASSITYNSANLSWTPTGTETAWEFDYGPSPWPVPAGSGTATNSSTVNPISPLLPATTYQFYVRAFCDPEFSSWSGPVSFTTPCEPIVGFPWCETFDTMTVIGNNILPECWAATSPTGTPWYSGNAASISYNDPCSTPNYVYVYYSPSLVDKFLITPGFALTALTSYDFKFDWVGDGYTGWTGDVLVNTAQTGTGATVLGSSFVVAGTTTTATCIPEIRTFVPATTGTFYFMIRVNNSGVPWYLGFDDFCVELSPACPQPTSLSAIPAAYMALLDWTENGSAADWDVEYGPTPYTFTEIPTFSTASKPYNLFGLDPETEYVYKVRSDCGTETSLWSVAKTFTTLVSCPTPTALTATNITFTGADLGWTSNASGTTWNVEVGAPGFTPGTGASEFNWSDTEDNPVSAGGLTASTQYDFYVQEVCGFVDPKIEHFWMAQNVDYILDPDPLISGGMTEFLEPGETLEWLNYDQSTLPWYNIWFYNDTLDLNRMKKIRMGFWIQKLDAGLDASFDYVINWSTPGWNPLVPGFPTPMDEAVIERSPENGPTPILGGPEWVEIYYTIPDYNPEWVSVDIWGSNIIILNELNASEPPHTSPLYNWWLQNPQPGGILVHECLPKPYGDVSLWAGPFTFTTSCAAIADLPYVEGFELAWPPVCWTDPVITAYGWDQSIYGGPNSGLEWAYCNLANSELFTPDFTIATNDLNLVFWYRAEYIDYPQDMQVKINGTMVYQITGAINETYQKVEIPLGAYIGQTISISFVGQTGTGGYDYGICLDDFSVSAPEPCTTNTWLGVGTAWDDPANWSCGEIPNATINVIIPTAPVGGLFPVIGASVAAECFDITIETPGTLTIQGTLHIINP